MSKDSRYSKIEYKKDSKQQNQSTKKEDTSRSSSSKPKQEIKSKTFTITKSYTPDDQSETYKKYILPHLNNLKRLQEQKRRNDELREKMIQQQKQLLKQQERIKQESNKDKVKDKEKDDLEKGVYVDKDGRTRDADGNLVLIQNDTFTTTINKNLIKKEQLKEMEKKNQNKLYERASKIGFHDNNIVGSSKNRLRRTLGGLQFQQQEEDYSDEEQQTNLMGDDLMDLLTAPKERKRTRKLKKIKRTKLQTQDLIPEKEWWDAEFVSAPGYFPPLPETVTTKEEVESFHNSNILEANPDKLKEIIDFSKINDSVTQFDLFPEVEQKGVVIPVFLTKDEKKKLKRIRKREKLQEKNDKIKLGFIEPDKPKLKLSNMALVMKQEYIIDPSRVEFEVRKEIQQRLDIHNQTNQSRKLSRQKRIQKATRKLKRDSAKQTRIAVFRINQVKDRTHRFKIEMNAKQLALNGLFLFPGDRYKGPAVIVAEGGRRSIKFYKNLLLNRINWSEIDRANLTVKHEEEDEQIPHEKINIKNKCQLIWEAVVTDKLFSKWRAVEINNDTEAIRTLAERKAEHFWDMILNFKQEA